MTRPKLSHRLQGLLLIGSAIAVIGVWLAGPLREHFNSQADIAELEARLERHETRLASLPQPDIEGTPLLNTTDPLSVPEMQQAVSFVLRQGGTRLRSLSPAEDTVFAELPAKQWSFEIEGDPQAIEEMVKAMQQNRSFLISTINLEPINARELRVSGELLRLNDRVPLPSANQTSRSFLTRNPFDSERRPYQRAQQIEAPSDTTDITLLGISRRNGKAIAILNSPQYGEAVVSSGDRYGPFEVVSIDSTKAELVAQNGRNRIISLFEN